MITSVAFDATSVREFADIYASDIPKDSLKPRAGHSLGRAQYIFDKHHKWKGSWHPLPDGDYILMEGVVVVIICC